MLYAPPSYRRAPRFDRERVCNGCGAKGWQRYLIPDTFYCLDISEACNIHDWMYAKGQTIEDKWRADRVFLNNLERLIQAAGGPWLLRFLRRRRAVKYYAAVDLFGGPAFWKGKNLEGTEKAVFA